MFSLKSCPSDQICRCPCLRIVYVYRSVANGSLKILGTCDTTHAETIKIFPFKAQNGTKRHVYICFSVRWHLLMWRDQRSIGNTIFIGRTGQNIIIIWWLNEILSVYINVFLQIFKLVVFRVTCPMNLRNDFLFTFVEYTIAMFDSKTREKR